MLHWVENAIRYRKLFVRKLLCVKKIKGLVITVSWDATWLKQARRDMGGTGIRM